MEATKDRGTLSVSTVRSPKAQTTRRTASGTNYKIFTKYDSFSRDQIVHVTADFNDCDDICEAIGPNGIGNKNENGERLVNFCIANKLRVEHTFHKNKTSQKAKWFHPPFGTPGVIDSALVQREHAKHAADIRVLPSVDTRSDH